MNKKQPIIGITTVHTAGDRANFALTEHFVAMVTAAGGLPVLLPNLDRDQVDQIADQLDGLVLSAGPDVPAQFYGAESRDTMNDATIAQIETSLRLIERMLKQQKPMFGVCLGHQLLNVAFGGTLIQDIPTERPDAIKHNKGYRNGKNGAFFGARHKVYPTDGSFLQAITGKPFLCESYHHQAVGTVGRGVKVSATAPDGIIEATEFPTQQLVFSVQWHPEVERTSPQSQALFAAVVDAARIRPAKGETVKPKPRTRTTA